MFQTKLTSIHKVHEVDPADTRNDTSIKLLQNTLLRLLTNIRDRSLVGGTIALSSNAALLLLGRRVSITRTDRHGEEMRQKSWRRRIGKEGIWKKRRCRCRARPRDWDIG